MIGLSSIKENRGVVNPFIYLFGVIGSTIVSKTISQGSNPWAGAITYPQRFRRFPGYGLGA